MNPINKPAIKAAVLIHEQLCGAGRQDVPIYLPEYCWNRIQQLRRQIALANQRGWPAAARQLAEEMPGLLNDCRRELENALRSLESCHPERPVSSVGDIYRDLLALDGEFEGLEIDLEKHEVSVTTDAIELEEIYLGAFEIRLDWQRLGSGSSSYHIVATDPHPPASRDDVTHPHVQDEQLCEGEGRLAVRAALAEGRLTDFFLLVSQLLHNYGEGSAYVELNNWDGKPCSDCGASTSGDGEYYCQRCECTLCSSCSILCHGCDESYCSECIDRCAGCDDSYCSGCLDSCAACGHDYCSNCLETCPECGKRFCGDCREEGSEEGLCKSCYEKQNHEEEKEDQKDDPPPNDTRKSPGTRSRPTRRRRTTTVAAPA